ncbi:MAG: glycosyltransferase family 9 protein [Sedimentisphaerales bacterium]|jgi:ADP-heptose:LPS heptosyltransferase
MCGKSNIIDKLREKLAIASQQGRRGVILQPGAIGDCILTLPLAELMKETVCPGGVDIIGHTEYLGMLSGRSCVDVVRSLDSISLHRLFAGEGDFEVADGDPLIMAFAGYSWIASFLGESDSHFEKNLIFTVNCSNSAEVITLAMKPDERHNIHISDFYRKQFVEQSGLSPQEHNSAISMPLIRPTQADIYRGREILAENGIMPTVKPAVIHPGSGGAHKCWHLDNFLAVARMLEKEGTDSVFLLGPAEMERFGESTISYIRELGNLLTDLPLSDVLAVLSCSRAFLGNDSGITHLAAALGIRTVAVFGPTDPAVYRPIGSAVTILQNNTPDFTEATSENLQNKAAAVLLAT